MGLGRASNFVRPFANCGFAPDQNGLVCNSFGLD